MYSTCLFCAQHLGRNEVIEHFPVGRRLAFDAAKGRLWVVCRKCERWNLTPLEERWEAIEECERAFCDTKRRVSTDNIGLARLREGTELVRIGEPQRPEMAAWRYGDQFGRRWRRQMAIGAVPGMVLPIVGQWGIAAGLLGAGMAMPVVYSVYVLSHVLFKSRARVQVDMVDGAPASVSLLRLRRTRIFADDDGIRLELPVADTAMASTGMRITQGGMAREYTGDDALRIAARVLPYMNRQGGSRAEVTRAVNRLEESSNCIDVFRRAAATIERRDVSYRLVAPKRNALVSLSMSDRLALEMAAHEDAERRALEGELHVLEAAWTDAEVIAGIADDLLLPDSVATDLARLKKEADG